MKMQNTLIILSSYGTCPLCGSDKLGNGAGTLDIEDADFKRTCKCGWVVKGIETTDEEIFETFNNITI